MHENSILQSGLIKCVHWRQNRSAYERGILAGVTDESAVLEMP
jgi:hypothetical protein